MSARVLNNDSLCRGSLKGALMVALKGALSVALKGVLKGERRRPSAKTSRISTKELDIHTEASKCAKIVAIIAKPKILKYKAIMLSSKMPHGNGMCWHC